MSSLRKRSRRATPAFDHGEPIKNFSILPILIFVAVIALVLLQTYKPRTHAVVIDLPHPMADPNTGPNEGVVNRIGISQGGVLSFNGANVTQQQLLERLHASIGAIPEPMIAFEPDALASYDVSAKVLNIVRISGSTRFCFVGLEKYRDFGKDETGVNPGVTKSIAKVEQSLRLYSTLNVNDDYHYSDDPLPRPDKLATECDALAKLP